MEVGRDGRALPPRPSLLVGGAEDCYREWARLEQKASALLAALPDDSTTGQLEQLEFALKQLRGDAAPMLPAPLQHLCAGLSSQAAAHRRVVQQMEELVAPFRWLRESLVSNLMVHTDLARQVYECTCDVTAVVGREAAPELLKALQGLVTDIYPSLHTPQHTQHASAASPSGRTSGSVTSQESRGVRRQALYVPPHARATDPTTPALPPPHTSATHYTSRLQSETAQANDAEQQASPQQATQDVSGAVTQVPHASSRMGEVRAAHLLFFYVAPARPSALERVGVMAGLARGGGGGIEGSDWGHPALQWALQVVCALSRTDWARVWALRARVPCSTAHQCSVCSQGHRACGIGLQGSTTRTCTPSRLLREILDMHLAQVRGQALQVSAIAYHRLPWRLASPLLGLTLPALHNTLTPASIPSELRVPASLLATPADSAWHEDRGHSIGLASHRHTEQHGTTLGLQGGHSEASQSNQGTVQQGETSRTSAVEESLTEVSSIDMTVQALVTLVGMLVKGEEKGVKGASVAKQALVTYQQQQSGVQSDKDGVWVYALPELVFRAT